MGEVPGMQGLTANPGSASEINGLLPMQRRVESAGGSSDAEAEKSPAEEHATRGKSRTEVAGGCSGRSAQVRPSRRGAERRGEEEEVGGRYDLQGTTKGQALGQEAPQPGCSTQDQAAAAQCPGLRWVVPSLGFGACWVLGGGRHCPPSLLCAPLLSLPALFPGE